MEAMQGSPVAGKESFWFSFFFTALYPLSYNQYKLLKRPFKNIYLSLFLKKFKIKLPCDLKVHFWVNTPKKVLEGRDLKRCLHTHVPSSSIHNS